MRTLSLAIALTLVACVAEDDAEDLGSVIDGKGDGAIIDVSISVPKKASSGSPGVRNFTVHSSSDFDVKLEYTSDQAARLIVTNGLDGLGTGPRHLGPLRRGLPRGLVGR